MTEISFEIPDRDERGVSPVIGVILMVAITVILAAVIASFVLGFGDQVSQSVQAGADISETNDGNATVTWISEGNAESLNITHNGGDTVNFVDNQNLTSVGETAELYTTESSQTVRITVTAVGSGGAKTVITQEEVTLQNSTA